MSRLIELPFHLPGRVLRSPMPFKAGDWDGEIFRQYQEWEVQVVVQLVSDHECRSATGRDLRSFYRSQGMQVIYVPVPDFGIPVDLAAFQAAVQRAIECARAGQNIVIHCYAGQGRTGMFVAFMARQILNISPREAIRWVRQYIPSAVETPEQVQFVLEHAW